MDNKTFLGEYCGYEKHQHITTYEKIEIIFFAIIVNNSKDSCLPPLNAIEILEKYSLKHI